LRCDLTNLIWLLLAFCERGRKRGCICWGLQSTLVISAKTYTSMGKTVAN
jgi:hypothetical protein